VFSNPFPPPQTAEQFPALLPIKMFQSAIPPFFPALQLLPVALAISVPPPLSFPVAVSAIVRHKPLGIQFIQIVPASAPLELLELNEAVRLQPIRVKVPFILRAPALQI
jgi:hypothetical protein